MPFTAITIDSKGLALDDPIFGARPRQLGVMQIDRKPL